MCESSICVCLRVAHYVLTLSYLRLKAPTFLVDVVFLTTLLYFNMKDPGLSLFNFLQTTFIIDFFVTSHL